jgi:hypothetical protein
MRQNLTLSLDTELIRKARVLAAERSTSVSQMLGKLLEAMVEDAAQYDRAKRSAVAQLHIGFHLGGRPATRDELHER